MSHKIRLGPIAVFLAVITAVLATLAILTISTARADTALAGRFAQVTQIRYALEADGSRFLSAADAWFAPGGTGEETLPEGASAGEDGTLSYYEEQDGYALSIVLTENTGKSGYDITEWKITRLWEGEDPFENIWQG